LISACAGGAFILPFDQQLEFFRQKGFAISPNSWRDIWRQANVELRPYWQYMSMQDVAVRHAHASLHGRVYRYDHPFWDTWYPPNGFNCRCYVKALTPGQVKAKGT
jgi:SPP1 gp7 family putative phage head morphogenesis protein